MSSKRRSTPWAKDTNELAAWTNRFLAESENDRLAQAEADADARCAFLDEIATRVDEICETTREHLDGLTDARADRALDEADARIRYCNAVFDWYDDFSAECQDSLAEAEKARRQVARAETKARRAEALARRRAVARTLAAHAVDRENWWGMGAEAAPVARAASTSRRSGPRSSGTRAAAAAATGAASPGRRSRRSNRRAGGVSKPQQLSGQDVIRSLRSRAAA